MPRRQRESFLGNFKRFFVRGLGILLPSVLTIWILLAAYQFVQTRIADPINKGLRELVIRTTTFPTVTEEQMRAHEQDVGQTLVTKWRNSGDFENARRLSTRRAALQLWWEASWTPLDLIGLIVAIILIYLIGGVLGSFIGRRFYQRGEQLLNKLPLFRNVYPSVKQVTDFFVGEQKDRIKFNRVVAVQYPRKGLWSVGLVTGDTMRTIQSEAGQHCLTVFVPSSPTPFTGYVITVPEKDAIDLGITIDEALRFAISGGVIVPAGQLIHKEDGPAPGLETEPVEGEPGSEQA